ncbi:hypothetical protein KDK82_6024 [Delftia sp. K82]|uniref:hypothetical protein n=1 Tax=Delftia sp. K82 TaxID=1472718 RepID=UPI000B723F6C|nr:hypothetical protein [Delftia sp. K82]OWG12597.1 hypothetical protein KDK82_6024 [Delftia sp. K82]
MEIMIAFGPEANQYRSTGIVLRFGFPTGNTVEVFYSDFRQTGSSLREGHQRKRLVLEYNDQCCVDDVVTEIERAADALGIVFDPDPTLSVEVPLPPSGNWLYLAAPVAKRLGWKLEHPFQPIELSPWTCD